MKNVEVVEQDGHLTLPAEALEQAGFRPGDRVQVKSEKGRLIVAPEADMLSVFEMWRGIDRSSPPRSVEELVAAQREMRGRDDLD